MRTEQDKNIVNGEVQDGAMFPDTSDHIACWLHYLRIFALQTPFGLPVKITIGVSQYDGEKLAREWRMEPRDVVDAYGRAARQVESAEHLIAIEWLTPNREKPLTNPISWGGITAWPKGSSDS